MLEPTAEEYADLGRRAVACSAWRWLPGMRLRSGYRILFVGAAGAPVCAYESEGMRQTVRLTEGLRPDLSDAATRWLVLEMVREKVPGAYVQPIRGAGVLYVVSNERGFGLREDWEFHPTEAHALVAALEAVSR